MECEKKWRKCGSVFLAAPVVKLCNQQIHLESINIVYKQF